MARRGEGGEPPSVDGVANLDRQLIRGYGLHQVIMGAFLDALHGCLDVVYGTDHDAFRRGAYRLDRLEQLELVHAGQSDIDECHIKTLILPEKDGGQGQSRHPDDIAWNQKGYLRYRSLSCKWSFQHHPGERKDDPRHTARRVWWSTSLEIDQELNMEKPIEHYWNTRLAELKETLEGNNFEVFMAPHAADAKRIVLEEILPRTGARRVSWGGSMTFVATGLYEALKTNPDLEIIDTLDKTVPPEEFQERRRQALLTDLFITGSNAITEAGALVNLDMIGNRVAAITFGPRHVVILVGRNKIVPDLDDAIHRIKNFAAPVNAMRLDKKTPCLKTSYCEECKSPDRICNYWTITEKSFPKGRIKVVLINEDMGL